MRAPTRWFGIVILLVGSSVLTRIAPAQSPRLELDHVYIVVQPPVSRAADALRRAGVMLDTTIQRHEGQGTASIAAFFENAYLELLWVDSATAVDSAHRTDVADFRRAADWRASGASPFGLGLHVIGGRVADLPIPARRDPAPHLGPDVFYLILRQPAETLAADVFIMPAAGAVTTWLDRFRTRRPELFAHAIGARRVTRVLLHGSPANRPRAIDLDPRLIGFEAGPMQYVTVEFDSGGLGREWDLRPILPLVLRR
jgi:hypothetical protein